MTMQLGTHKHALSVLNWIRQEVQKNPHSYSTVSPFQACVPMFLQITQDQTNQSLLNAKMLCTEYNYQNIISLGYVKSNRKKTRMS